MATNTEVGVKITVDGSEASSSTKKLRDDVIALKTELKGLQKGTEEYEQKLKQVNEAQKQLDEFSGLGNLKRQLKDATVDLIAMRAKFGETSAEAVAAAKRVANLKDEIGDAKAMTEAFNPDAKFKGLGAALQGVAGGFAAIQGAQAIFGAESKDLEKTLLKVQGAMALTQGINSVLEAKDSFKVLKTVAIDTFKGIKTAIGSTGIGLLVIALGTLVAYWDDIKEAVSGVSEEQTKLNETTKKNLEAEQNKLKAIGDQDNILKLQGKSEREILQIKIKQYDATIKAAEASIQSEAEIQKVKEQAAKRNYELTKNIIRGSMEFGMVALRVLAAPIDLVIATANKAAELLGFEKIVTENINDQITKLTTTASETLAKFLFDPEETKKEGEKTVKEAKDNLAKLKNERAGLQLAVQKIDEDAAKKQSDKAEADAKKREEEEKKRLQELEEFNKKLAEQQKASDDFIIQQRLQSFKNEFDRKQFELSVQNQAEIDKQIELLNQKLITEQEYNNRKAIIDAEYAAKQAENEAARQAAKKTKEDEDRKKQLEAEKAAAEERVRIAEIEAKRKEEIQNSYVQVVTGAIGLIKAIGEKNKGIQKVALIAENAVTIAKIILDTQKQIASAAASAALVPPLLPPGIPNPAWFAAKAFAAKQIAFAKVNAGIGIATSIAATAKGLSQLGGGSAGGGGGATGGGASLPNAPAAPLQPQAETTLLNQGQVNQIGNVAARAYVVESDVSGNQQRIQRLERAARIA